MSSLSKRLSGARDFAERAFRPEYYCRRSGKAEPEIISELDRDERLARNACAAAAVPLFAAVTVLRYVPQLKDTPIWNVYFHLRPAIDTVAHAAGGYTLCLLGQAAARQFPRLNPELVGTASAMVPGVAKEVADLTYWRLPQSPLPAMAEDLLATGAGAYASVSIGRAYAGRRRTVAEYFRDCTAQTTAVERSLVPA